MPEKIVDDNEKARRKREFGLFLWRLNIATQALRALYDQAVAAAPDGPDPVYPSDPGRTRHWLDTVPIAFYGAALWVRNGINEVVRHSCAGALLQISQTMLERYYVVLGVGPTHGPLYNGEERFSRVLWAARNAFVHGDEWAECVANGYKLHRMGVESIRILKVAGVENPVGANAFDLFCLLSEGGDIVEFRARLIASAKAALESPPVSTKREKSDDHAAKPDKSSWAVVGIVVGLIVLFLEKVTPTSVSIDYVAQPSGEGTTVSIAVAANDVSSSYALLDALRNTAIAGLPLDAAAKYLAYKSLEATFTAAVTEIVEFDQEREDFTSRLLEVCTLAQQWHEKNMSLPDPINEFIGSQLQARPATPEAIYAILAELARRSGFTPQPYKANVLELAAPPPANIDLSEIFGSDKKERE